jgi:hypothetical protein
MSILRSFFGQPHRRYRDFQIVFALLTLNFSIPAVSYVVAPEIAHEQFSRIGEMFGGGAYTAPEPASRVWRYLGAANVMTLGLMCFLMQLNLRRNYVLLGPLTFLKAYNATLFAGGFAVTGYPAFLAIALFDFLTSAAFVFFSRRAYRAIEGRPDGELVPRPGWRADRCRT